MIFRNTTPDRLDLPSLGVSVDPGETFEATGDAAKSLESHPDFTRVDTPARQRAAAARRKDNDETEES